MLLYVTSLEWSKCCPKRVSCFNPVVLGLFIWLLEQLISMATGVCNSKEVWFLSSDELGQPPRNGITHLFFKAIYILYISYFSPVVSYRDNCSIGLRAILNLFTLCLVFWSSHWPIAQQFNKGKVVLINMIQMSDMQFNKQNGTLVNYHKLNV